MALGKPMNDPVVQAAQEAFSLRLQDNNDVSANTKNAQAIAKIWRGSVHQLDPDRYHIEAMVAPALDQKIDVVDTETGTAYELKVSGKNATAEFYKDVVKAIIWNEKKKRKLSKLVFITEEVHGRPFLDAPMPKAYTEYLQGQGLEVVISYVTMPISISK